LEAIDREITQLQQARALLGCHLRCSSHCGTSGTDVTYEFGYYDWMYMVHDFAEFTGGTPTETLNPLEAVFVERIRTVGSGPPFAVNTDSRLIL
jgi:hypothetical protein